MRRRSQELGLSYTIPGCDDARFLQTMQSCTPSRAERRCSKDSMRAYTSTLFFQQSAVDCIFPGTHQVLETGKHDDVAPRQHSRRQMRALVNEMVRIHGAACFEAGRKVMMRTVKGVACAVHE